MLILGLRVSWYDDQPAWDMRGFANDKAFLFVVTVRTVFLLGVPCHGIWIYSASEIEDECELSTSPQVPAILRWMWRIHWNHVKTLLSHSIHETKKFKVWSFISTRQSLSAKSKGEALFSFQKPLKRSMRYAERDKTILALSRTWLSRSIFNFVKFFFPWISFN